MNNRPKDNQPKMTSACEIYRAMLEHPAIARTHHVGGGVGVTTNGKAIFNPSGNIESYDKDTNDLLRAKFACDAGMVLSPLSNESRMFYTDPEKFNSELEAAQRIAEENKEGWFSRFRTGK